MKQRIRLIESDLHRMIKESVKEVLNEDYDPFTGKPNFNRSFRNDYYASQQRTPRAINRSNTNNNINYPYIEKLLENSYIYLEKYRAHTNDGVITKVMESVADWISRAKVQLDAYFKQ